MLGRTHVVGSLAVVHVGLLAYTSHINKDAQVTLQDKVKTVFGFPFGLTVSFAEYLLISAVMTLFVLFLLRVGKSQLLTIYAGSIGIALIILALAFDTKYAFALALILLSFGLGTLLPDIDSETSTIGRYVLPISRAIPHRTITHTIWAVILILAFGIYFGSIYLCALALGYALHIAEDSFSNQGICWFYPLFGKYDYFAGGGAKKRGRKTTFAYRTGGLGETLVFYGAIVIHLVCVTIVSWKYLM